MNRIKIFLLLLLVWGSSIAQEDLLDLLEDAPDDGLVSSTFKSTRIINGHSIEVRSPRVLEFVISHRFGNINQGSEQFWGLDQSNIRLALEYGVIDNLNIGLGRSSFDKTIDFYLKYQLLKQSNKMPVTVTGFGSLAKTTDQSLTIKDKHRLNYTGQLLVARKVNSKLSLQLAPTFVQRNLVPSDDDANGLFALGIGGRQKLTQRMTVNFEYYHQLTDYNSTRQNAIALGVDIETGGHVFQLHLTNAQQMNEKGFIGETNGDFFDGDVRFGFNISRVFDLQAGNKSGD